LPAVSGRTIAAQLAEADEPPLLHPSMADLYRSKVDELAAALQREDTRLEASEIAGPFDRGSIARGHRILPVRDGIRQGFSFDWFRQVSVDSSFLRSPLVVWLSITGDGDDPRVRQRGIQS